MDLYRGALLNFAEKFIDEAVGGRIDSIRSMTMSITYSPKDRLEGEGDHEVATTFDLEM